jgi:hypothetical protein
MTSADASALDGLDALEEFRVGLDPTAARNVPFRAVRRRYDCGERLEGDAMTDGFAVDRASLVRMAQAINATIDGLNNLVPISEAANGQGFPLPLGETQAGHPDVYSALKEYDQRWGWGVQDLLHAAQNIAGKLGASALIYGSTENYLDGVIKQLYQDEFGKLQQPGSPG